MEFVNEFIKLSIQINPDITNSFSCITSINNHVLLTFGLHSNNSISNLGQKHLEFKIEISNDYFRKYNEKVNFDEEKKAICCVVQSKLIEIINCSLKDLQRKLFLESQILFLLQESQKQVSSNPLSCSRCINPEKPVDIEKMRLAQDFILNNLSENITIPIIANNVGTNQCYLKKGFKQVFNQTIFEYIKTNRMIKAQHLLQNNHFKITEISYQVGYSSISSFSQAYKKHFGTSPLEHTKINS